MYLQQSCCPRYSVELQTWINLMPKTILNSPSKKKLQWAVVMGLIWVFSCVLLAIPTSYTLDLLYKRHFKALYFTWNGSYSLSLLESAGETFTLFRRRQKPNSALTTKPAPEVPEAPLSIVKTVFWGATLCTKAKSLPWVRVRPAALSHMSKIKLKKASVWNYARKLLCFLKLV